jgi:polar amino acid transport system substrate-binding protein
MKREMAVIGFVACLAVGLGIGWFLPGLLTPASTPGQTLVEEIQTRGELIVGTDAPWPPFELYNTTTSKWEGFDIDLSQMIADELGVTLTVTNILFDELIGACKAGTIDMIAAAMMVRHSRAQELAHSVTYIRVNEVIVVLGNSTLSITSLDNLTSYVVGCQGGTTQHDALIDLGFIEGGNLKVYPKADTLMLNLHNGVIDAAFVDEPVVSVWSKTYSLKIIFTVPAEPMAMWSRWEEPELMMIINKVILEAYRDGVMDDLYTKWFS